MATGVALGAPTPYQALASYPGTNSPAVGISGIAWQRVAEVTANARNLPDLTYSISAGQFARHMAELPLPGDAKDGPS
jgi:hypothetical protein